MKKNSFLKILAILVFAIVFATVAFSCGENAETDRVVTKVEIYEAPETPYVVGDLTVDLSKVKLLITYSDKATEIVSLDDTMLQGEDRKKFTIVGTHAVTVNYGGKQAFYQFEVIAQKEQKTYLAKFYSMGGSDVDSYYASTVTAFSVPERTGYTFDGWYLDMEYSGSKVREPYALTEDTSFYAKWIDNRVCSVSFLDYDKTVIYTEEIHYGEKINVADYVYPDELVQDGRTFSYWDVTNGNADAVTVDLVVMARFIISKCVVKVVYARTDGTSTDEENAFDYQTEFSVGEGTRFIKPEKEGYTSRFVVYYNHAEDHYGEYEELPENNTLVLTEPYTTVMPIFTVLTYDVIIYNGKTTQSDANLKSGNIELERTYENADTLRNFSVDWNTAFDFAEYTQDPNISAPAGIVGYNGEWCFVSATENGDEILYNKNGMIWNAEEQTFDAPTDRPEGETDNYWTLYDSNKNYVALVVGGKLTAIKNDVTVKALYTKRTFQVRLVRLGADGTNEILVTFMVKYLTDFNIYDVSSYPYEEGVYQFPARDVTLFAFNSNALREKAAQDRYNPTKEGTDIEKMYLKENTDFSVKTLAMQGGYYLTNQVREENVTEEDWTVTWYNSATSQDSDAVVDFKNGAGEKSVITATTTFYCRDTDNRKYEILFYHKYNFNTNWYDESEHPVATQFYYGEKEIVSPPLTNESVNFVYNGVTLSYTFSGWYDTPYSVYLKTGARGNRLTDFTKRNESVNYYAHYDCNTTRTIKIFDKTQSVAYIGKTGTTTDGFEYEDCAVADNTIIYNVPAGSYFDLSLVYKGKVIDDVANTTSSGQNYYDNHKANEFYQTYYVGGALKNYLTGKFGSSDPVAAMRAITTILTAFENDYKNCINKVYAHEYTDYSVGNDGEFAYYMILFNSVDPADPKIETLKSERESLLAKGEKIVSVLDEAGYTNELSDMLGNVYEFIEYYAALMKTLHENGYETKHTGLAALGMQNSELNLDRTFSDYRMIVTARHILEEYIEFLTEYASYTEKQISPTYENSATDLNGAYGYTGDDIKYSFSGWYRNANYTIPYQQDFELVPFVASEDIALYAKWTDITRGTEGLVYEEVTAENGSGDSITAYVLVDFTNRAEYAAKSEYASEWYSVTTNDVGAVPEEINPGNSTVELQIPSTVDKYIDVTAEAQANKNDWANHYRNYYVKRSGSYVQAYSIYLPTSHYYVMQTYPVIGISENALSRYNSYIENVTIPLSLRFVEEGAFRGCNVLRFSTMGKRDEVSLGFVTVPTTQEALYQKNVSEFVTVKGKKSEKVFDTATHDAILAYSIGYKETTAYEIEAGTQYIGKYAFQYATALETITGTDDVTEIHDYAFAGATKLKTFGAETGKVTIKNIVTTIGESAFKQCTEVTDLAIENGSYLTFIGKDAFKETKWYGKFYGIIVLKYEDNNGTTRGIALGHSEFSVQNAEASKYNENGEIDANGAYSALVTDGAKVLLDEKGAVAFVHIDVDLRNIAGNAFDSVNAHCYVIKSVKEIGDEAFCNNPELTKIKIKSAYNGEETVLGSDVFYGKGAKSVEIEFPDAATKNTVTNHASWDAYQEILIY